VVVIPLDAAKLYLRWGLSPLPIKRGEKAPKIAGWRHFKCEPGDVARWFGRPCNVGVMLGAQSGGIVDVDLDCPEAIELAPQFLPVTRTFGRASKPASHWIFRAEPLVGTAQFRDPEGGMLCELRSTGGQTVFPGSVHPSGEAIEFTDISVRFAVVDGADLRARVGQLAAAVLLRRHPNPTDAIKALAARWRGEVKAPPVTRNPVRPTSLDVAERARRYLAKMPPAIEGSGGSKQTYTAALALVKGFGLPPPDAFALLAEYNATSCRPPWTEKQLLQKIASAVVSDLPAGYLLDRKLAS